MTAEPLNPKVLLDALRHMEQRCGHPREPVRETLTGPLVDACFMGKSITRTLQCGLRIQFRHTGRISREFLLAPDSPDHVWEPQTTHLLLHFASRARHIIVGGAFFGDQALLLAKQCAGHGGHVHAFEPNPAQHEALRTNAEVNGLGNLTASRLGLWSRSRVWLQFEGSDELASPHEAAHESPDSVATTSIDAYLAENGITDLDLLMIDIEGGEHAALQGAVCQLAKSADRAPIIVFETHSRYSDWSQGLENSESGRLLTAHGYQLYAIRDYHANTGRSRAPIELIPAAETYIEGPHHGFNMLAIKEGSQLRHPLFRLVRNVSPKLLPHKSDPLFEPLPPADTSH